MGEHGQRGPAVPGPLASDLVLASGVWVYVAFVIDVYAGAIFGWTPRGPSRPASWN
jgi:hypothetical protein